MYNCPTGTELVGVGDRFIAKDGDRWYIMQNFDYEDAEGNMGMSTEYVGDTHGYASEAEAERALRGID